MRLQIRCVIALVICALGACQARAGVTLVQNGEPRATIVLSEKPTASAQLAAFELQHYLEKISGARLPIAREPQSVSGTRIVVGESDATRQLKLDSSTLVPQEYVIKTAADALILLGYDKQDFSDVQYDEYHSLYNVAAGPIGTCYAVHGFLETTLGVRWYYPNETLGEVVPANRTIAIDDLDIRRKPDAPIRSVYPLFANTEHLYFTDWNDLKKFDASWVNARTSILYWIRNRACGDMRYNANHSFHGYDAAFGQSHPEWFSTKSYAKMKQLDYQMGVQPCLSDPGFFDAVVKIARGYFDGAPPENPSFYAAASGDFFPIVPNDNTNMCGCAECRAQYRNDVGPEGNASHYVWGFLNRVAKEVRKSHPNAMISGLAYFNYTTPPKDLIFEPNVAVTFCKFYVGYANKNVQEQDYRRISQYVSDNRARFFTTWEYQLKPHMTEWAFPCLAPHVHADDVKRLSALGPFMGGTNQFLYLNTYSDGAPGVVAWASPVMDFMNIYWRFKLYDDFKYDVDQGLEEYYQNFFGPAAQEMKQFYSAMEKRWMEYGGGADSRSWWGKMGTRQFVDEVAGYIEQAKHAAGDGNIYRQRVDLIDAGILQHMRKARVVYEGSSMSEFAPIANAAVAAVQQEVAGDNWACDATWTHSPVYEIAQTHLNQAAPQKTMFQLAYDSRNFYLKVKCLEPRIADIKISTHEADVGGFSDDSIELFIDPSGTGATYYQFCINSAGAVYDALENPTAIGATATISWDSEMQVKSSTGKDFWELRMAIPLKALGDHPPAPGSTWRFNLCRNRFTEADAPPFSGWSVTMGGYKNPERFGIVTFNSPKDRGRLLWNCDFEGGAYAGDEGRGALIGADGWYESVDYANLGWDKSWTVETRDGSRVAVCDVNNTNPSNIVPMHGVRVSPGVVSVEADYRRSALQGNAPQLLVTDARGNYIAYFSVWHTNGELVSLELPQGRQNFGPEQHGLGAFAAPGKWFGMKLTIDTVKKQVTGFIRSGRDGKWVRLHANPAPYYEPQAQGDQWFIGFGSRKHDTVDNNVVEMDDIRVMQASDSGRSP